MFKFVEFNSKRIKLLRKKEYDVQKYTLFEQLRMQ